MKYLPVCILSLAPALAPADTTPQPLPFTQDWSDGSLIATNDDWSGVPGIVGYRGDGLTGSDPQGALGDGTPVENVRANQTLPEITTHEGVAEFALANPAIAIVGSPNYDCPHLVVHLDATGKGNIRVQALIRDVDPSFRNTLSQVALQFRAGSSGNFTNVPAAYISDATEPSTAVTETPIDVVLPAGAEDVADLQVRFITVDSLGNDEWLGIDDISVTGSTLAAAMGWESYE